MQHLEEAAFLRLDHCCSRVYFLLVLHQVVAHLELGLLLLFGLRVSFALHLRLLRLHSLAHPDVSLLHKRLRPHTSVNLLALRGLAHKVVYNLRLVQKVHLRDVQPCCFSAVIRVFCFSVNHHKEQTSQRVQPLLVPPLPGCLGVEGQTQNAVAEVEVLVDYLDRLCINYVLPHKKQWVDCFTHIKLNY